MKRCSTPATSRFGPPDPPAAVAARLLRLRAARRHDVAPPRPRHSRGLVPAADLLLRQHVGDPWPGRPGAGHRDGSVELDYELEVGALVDTPAVDLARGTGGGGDRRLPHPERLVGARPPARGDHGAAGPGQGQGLRHQHRSLAGHPRRAGRCRAGNRATSWTMTAEVNGTEISRGNWASAQFSFGDMLARASADARLRPGDLIGSGTVGTGCLLEVGEERLGRWLEPGDEVTLRIDRLGELRTPVVTRPEGRSAS